jgi:hypothetical protein
MRNILIYLYDILTYHDTLRNDIMTLLFTKQINTSNYKQNIILIG